MPRMPPKRPKPILFLDVECYKNYFLIQFFNPKSRKLTWFELTDDIAPPTHPHEDAEKVRAILSAYCIVTFNGINYDLPLVWAFFNGCTDPARLKKISDAIINSNQKWWHLERQFNYQINWRSFDQVDLIEVAPGKASLKLYGARLHCKKLQDLPIEPNAEITFDQRKELRKYCANDLLITYELYKALKPQLELREKMSMEYKVDLRSKSDAQIAEAVISKVIQKETGRLPLRQEVRAGTKMCYTPPAFIQFNSPELNTLLEMIKKATFIVTDSGKIMEPAGFKQPVDFGGMRYNLGIGGLHSAEQCVGYTADDKIKIVDRDVASYYPAIILNCELYPEHLGKVFLRIYRDIVNKRLEAKKSGDKVTAESLKITVNGSFGKLGNKYSFLFSPQLLLQVTLTGQLALLMLIERLQQCGAVIISANTDGVTFRTDKDTFHIISEWEQQTGFSTEETQYRSLFHRDVNNYIAVKTDNKVKSKGAYTPCSLNKNPTMDICTEAVVEFLRSEIPIEQTIRTCKDIRKFVSVRRVTGGAVQGEQYLGRVVRFYYSAGNENTINYKVNNYLVPKTLGAKPCMELPDELPADIDYNYYINEAREMLRETGASLW